MKKYLILFAFLFLLASSVLAEDIGYIVKDTANPDTNVINAIKELKYTYKLIGDSALPYTNFSKYKIVLIWNERLSNYNYIPVNEKKSFVANSYYLKDWKIADYVNELGSSGYAFGKIASSHVITEDLPSLFQIYETKGIGPYGLPYTIKDRARGIKSIIIDNSNFYPRSITGIIPKGGELYTGKTSKEYAKERIGFYGITETGYWTGESRQLFKNTLKWVLEGEDFDKDGFREEFDCNDNNAAINPNAEEISYNGIDENCDGKDLIDVDKDGYNAIISGGNDCNDNDETINPGSADVYKNCKNDAPLIDYIQRIIVSEGEIAIVITNAIDPENDTLIYSINDSRFIQENKNTFKWQTGYDDYGEHFFKAKASDGSLETEKKFEVSVRNKNLAPVCSNIPDLEWKEDETANLNLNNYCFDPDGNTLYYSIKETSESDNIILKSLENGIAVFSSKKDWNGNDWIIFSVTDARDEILTNKINLKITSVDDAPIFIKNIEDIIFSKGTNLINYLNLKQYFIDPDSNLSFSVTGNYFINITIENGFVSLYPKKHWFGDENIVFSATDGTNTLYSNAILLNVFDSNEPPEFEEMKCKTSILEDNEESCILNATDYEGDAFTFSIASENNLKCRIENENLKYISFQNYNGIASCVIRIKDNYGYNEFLFKVNIAAVNDAPIIKNYSPEGNPKIRNNTNRIFSVNAIDIDSNITISWLLDGVKVGNNASYIFNKNNGNYNLTVIARDSELEAGYFWNVFVGDISMFTCLEASGYICTEKQTCKGELLGVFDSSSCCSIQCSEKPPEFKEIDKCENASSNLILEIKKPGEDDKFEFGEKINFEVEIENKAKSDSFYVEAYLYDITNDKVLDEKEESIDIGKNAKKTINFEFNASDEMDDEDKYALFLKAEGDECSENYIEIGSERSRYRSIIEEIKLEPLIASCGDYIELNLKIRNKGAKDDKIYVLVESKELKINEKSEEFELEKYGERDLKKQSFNLRIPENLKEEKYKIAASAIYNGGRDSKTIELALGNCKKTEKETNEIGKVQLTGTSKEILTKNKENGNKLALILGLIFLGIILNTGIYVIAKIKSKQNNKMHKNQKNKKKLSKPL